MKKIILFLIFGLFLLIVGCKKPEPVVPVEPPEFTLNISPKNGDEAVGEKIPITILTIGGDSIAFKTKEKSTVHSYSRPAGLTGEWKIVDTLYVEEGLNQAFIDVFDFLPEGQVVIKNGQSDIIGHYPELNVSANPPQISWRTKSSVTIATAYGDSLVFSDLPGVNGKLNGTFPTPLLDSTTTFHGALWNTKTNNVTLRNITIIVDPSTKEDTLCKFGYWLFVKLEFQDSLGLPWYNSPLWECEKDDYIGFDPIAKKSTYYSGEIKCYDGEPDASQGPYNLVGATLFIGESNAVYYITKLTQDTLILVQYNTGGLQLSFRQTFIHPSAN